MNRDQIIRGAAHYNQLQADAWRDLAQQFADVLTEAADALGAAQPFSDTGTDKHAATLASINAALAKAKERGL